MGEQVDFALPNFRAVAADLKSQKVDLVFDAMDTHGNALLCQAMDKVGVRVTAKVTNVQNWSEAVRMDYRDAPGCRGVLWATGASRNHDETANPAVREFRTGMRGQPGGKTLSQWQLEGWVAAMWFTDAAQSCGDQLTRACVERFMNRGQPYTARGLLLPTRFKPSAELPTIRRNCLSVARWSDQAGGGRGAWVTEGGEMSRNCFTVTQLPYAP